jgi:hypothetical protein
MSVLTKQILGMAVPRRRSVWPAMQCLSTAPQRQHRIPQPTSRVAVPKVEKATTSASSWVADFFATARFQIAQSVTAALDPADRHELLSKYSVPTTSEATAAPPTALSIAEAVAKAKMEQAQKDRQRWEQEKQEILAQAAEASKQRVLQEMELTRVRRANVYQQWQKEQHEIHPILGQLVQDFGYKRTYTVALDQLKNVPVWEKQRTYRHARAQKMAKDKLQTLHLGMLGNIMLHQNLEGELVVLDGQHRIGMLQILQQENASALDFDKVPIEVHVQQQHHPLTHAEDIFLEVNKAEPIKAIDLVSAHFVCS